MNTNKIEYFSEFNRQPIQTTILSIRIYFPSRDKYYYLSHVLHKIYDRVSSRLKYKTHPYG